MWIDEARALVLALSCALFSGCSCAEGPSEGNGETGSPPGNGDSSGDSDPQGDTSAPASYDCELIGQDEDGIITFYEENPTYNDPVDHSGGWAESSPEEQGLDSALLNQAADELENRPYVNSLQIFRHGSLVLERYYHGSEIEDSNNVHSSSKSIIATLVGLALEQGHIQSLDQELHTFLPVYFKDIDDPSKRDITLRHLLTMSAGFQWEEDYSEYQIQQEEDWLKAILDLPLAHEPGEAFNYCTGQSHLMSAVLTQATGMSTCEFAHQNLFLPLGIVAEHWGRDPQGYFSGGCNVYLTPRELAKFGLLALNQGRWGDTQVVPAEWMAESTERHIGAGGNWYYGYYWWLVTLGGYDLRIAWGYGGQLIYVVNDLDLVVVVTTNTRDYLPDYDGAYLLVEYILPAVLD